MQNSGKLNRPRAVGNHGKVGVSLTPQLEGTTMPEEMRAVRDEEERPLPKRASAPVVEKTTWVDIALGIYVGGIALAVTSAIFWLIVVGLSLHAISIR